MRKTSLNLILYLSSLATGTRSILNQGAILFSAILLLPLHASSAQELIPFSQGGKYGYRSHNGEIVLQPRFEEAQRFQGDRAQVKMGEHWAIIDRKGDLAVAPVLDTPFVNVIPGARSSVCNRPAALNDQKRNRAIIVGSQVRLRSAPNLDGNTLQLLNPGETFELQEVSSYEEIPGLSRSCWMKVENSKGKGWVYGSFISLQFFENKEFRSWYRILDSDGIKNRFEISILRANKVNSFQITATSVIGYSQNGNYLAMDYGSDPLKRRLTIYNLQNSQPNFSCYYTDIPTSIPVPMIWQGNQLHFPRIREIPNTDQMQWEEAIFDNGTILTTGKKGQFTNPY